MTLRRTALRSLAALLTGLGLLRVLRPGPGASGRFVRRSEPGTRHRRFALGDRPLILRNDLFSAGVLSGLRVRGEPRED